MCLGARRILDKKAAEVSGGCGAERAKGGDGVKQGDSME